MPAYNDRPRGVSLPVGVVGQVQEEGHVQPAEQVHVAGGLDPSHEDEVVDLPDDLVQVHRRLHRQVRLRG